MLEFDEKDDLFVGDNILKEYSSCTDCGLCCKFFSQLPVYENEIIKIARSLNISPDDFQNKYLKKTSNSEKNSSFSLKTPCPFLKNNKCRIYHCRFLLCQTFPLFMNLSANTAILSGIYLCPQATQFYEGLLEFYKTNHFDLYNQLIEKEKHVKIDENGMELTGKVALFAPYLDWLYLKK